MTAPPRGSPPLPASSLPGRGPATCHHGRLRPAHPAPSGQGPARPARKLRRLGTGRGRYSRFPKPRPLFPAYPITTAPSGWGVVMGPGPLERRLRPAPPAREASSLPACASGVLRPWDGGSEELAVAERILLLQTECSCRDQLQEALFLGVDKTMAQNGGRGRRADPVCSAYRAEVRASCSQ